MTRRLAGTEQTRLLWLTVAVCGALAARVLLTGTYKYDFLVWNLFLAWIPYWLSCWIERLAGRFRPGTGILVFPTALWLLFLPNAPYIVTDFVHLMWAPAHTRLFDAVLIASFAATGMALGLLSLRRVHAVVADRLGAKAGWAFVGSVFVLTGAGMWMGRVLRWNSWDIVTNPVGILKTVARAVLAPWHHLPAVGFTFLCALGLAALYVFVTTRSRTGSS